jgi:hypothetical protein
VHFVFRILLKDLLLTKRESFPKDRIFPDTKAMQSVIQYRKIGISARKHAESDVEKAGFRRSQSPHILGDRSAVSTTIKLSSPTEVLPTELEENTTARTAFGPGLGIHPREHTTNEGKGGKVFVVDWEGDDDPLYPRNWSIVYRIWLTLVLALISFVVGAASSADTAILPQAAAEFGVSSVAQSMSIGSWISLF